MSNTTEKATPCVEKRLQCPVHMLADLEDAKQAAEGAEDKDGMPITESGLSWDYSYETEEIYPYFDYGVELLDHVRPDIVALGKIVGHNNLPYLQFGLAITTDRLVAGGFGGNMFRIYPDGGVTWAEPPVFAEDLPENQLRRIDPSLDMKHAIARIRFLKDPGDLNALFDLFERDGIPMGNDRWAEHAANRWIELREKEITLNKIGHKLDAIQTTRQQCGSTYYRDRRKKLVEEWQQQERLKEEIIDQVQNADD